VGAAERGNAGRRGHAVARQLEVSRYFRELAGKGGGHASFCSKGA
jgi:ribosomal protein S14